MENVPKLQEGASMGCLGTGEILMIGALLAIIFSASRMGSLGNAIGKFVYSFKKASKGDDLIDVNRRIDEAKKKREIS